MRKITFLLAFILFVGVNWANAQTNTIHGTVVSSEDGQGIPGVTVAVKGTTVGTTTDLDGKFSLDVKPEFKTLQFSYVGMKTVDIAISGQTEVNVTMEPDVMQMDEVVVTALGISREKKSLGYATQEVGGEELSTVKRDNFVDALSGRVAGVQIKANNNMGGSTNVIIRGFKSLTGNNQALFVVDGVPINNSTPNSSAQQSGQAGYDYGNAVSDIDPNNIESVNVLKGAAATALYGSRAANGVIIITTKSGKAHKDGLGISFSTNVTGGWVDKATFPHYQSNYGGGYGPYYSDSDHPGLYYYDVDGDGVDDYVVPTTEDASMGEKFDPNLMVYQWDAFDEASPNYMKKTPWVNAANGPITFFKTAFSTTNSVAVDGSTDKSAFRFVYTNLYKTGIMPNSKLNRHNFGVNASYDITKNVKLSTSVNYVHQNTTGRNATGYSDNILSSFRQWWEVNVDVQQLKDIYDATGRNVTWNRHSPSNGQPEYWNNFYWERYNNYETDGRDRIYGNVKLDWTITDYLSFMARASIDTYSQLQEERKAVGSVAGAFGINRMDVTSGYYRINRNFTETNYDAMLNFKKNITEKFNITAMLGTNIRRDLQNNIYSSTNGGLTVPDLYAIQNSANPYLTNEYQSNVGVNGVFGSVSLGWNNLIYVDATLRNDHSSTLPADNSSYMYPSVATSFVFSNLIESDWLQFGKIRLNYAEVGNDAPFASLYDTYSTPNPFGNIPLYSVPSTKNNSTLVPERTKNLEAGLEMVFLQKRLGFDFAAYKTNTINQIMPVSISTATGYSTKYFNSGEVENKGVELNIFGTPVKSGKLRWDINVNWSLNRNKVLSLYEGVDNMQLGSLQGGITINATVGQPFGTIQGTDYVYLDGQKVVASSGYYEKTSTSDNVLGDYNPDWMAGMTNTLTYGNWGFSFLIDMQQGGSVFSLDQWYGKGTGLYASTDFTNDLGNPVRNSIDDGGGLILDGVKEDGTPNDVRVAGNNYKVFGWSRNPNAGFIYDASYIKLREASLSYTFPQKMLGNGPFQNVSFSIVGSNLAILYKNLPDADPEAGQSAGKIQGWQSGVMPTTRNIGFNLKLNF